MIKKILLACIFIGIGYLIAVFLPMSPDWQITVKSPFKSDGVIGNSIVGELIGTTDEPVVEEVVAQEEDKTQYAFQSDLLVTPFDANVVFTILLGHYPTEASGNAFLESAGFSEVAPQYIPFKDPLGKTTLLLVLGEFKDEQSARKQEKSWESLYDFNLQIVKKPVLPEPEPEAPVA